ncbi:DUF350 domain-containing protein [Blastococcus sp. Marseille-P5729]|uniref:DUF350 domain-containing protein n=1 Tax=Blastococcus sp. Marseille-P5729 TaxID=2086582 RepID=UPI000D105F57|nr:DUF350 domain-containing protein [Blastococcus sp. Marseille-P5729]
MFEVIGKDALAAGAYSVVGILLMMLGFVVVDLLTPGKLPVLIWQQRNRNAAILTASSLLGVGLIVCAAINASEGDLGNGLLGTALYSLIGLAAMAVAFLIIDLLTPGRLGDALADAQPHPAVWVQSVLHLAIAAIVAVSLL